MVGYKTPNIDRMANRALFTGWWAAELHGGPCGVHHRSRHFERGTQVGLPGAKEGLQKEDVTTVELLKAQRYILGQLAKPSGRPRRASTQARLSAARRSFRQPPTFSIREAVEPAYTLGRY
jgi:hypothetical protein